MSPDSAHHYRVHPQILKPEMKRKEIRTTMYRRVISIRSDKRTFPFYFYFLYHFSVPRPVVHNGGVI